MNADERKRLRELEPPDCGDSSCAFTKKRGGMRTNGGCSCAENGDQVARVYFQRLHAAVPALLDALEASDSATDRLAHFIIGNIPGEPSQDQGAVDTAIRILDALQSENAALRAELERSRDLVTNLRLACECLHSAKEMYADIAEKSEAEEIVKLRERVAVLEKAAIFAVEHRSPRALKSLRAALDKAQEG